MTITLGVGLRPGLIRQGAEQYLESPMMTCVGVIESPCKQPLDVLLTDDLLNSAISYNRNVPMILCADLRYRSEVVNAQRKGANACVSVWSGFQHLSQAILEVHRGRTYLCPALSSVMCRLDKARDDTQITPRESDILEWLSRGYSSKQIARSLKISPHTVATHRRSLMQKLGAHKVAELARYALSCELFP